MWRALNTNSVPLLYNPFQYFVGLYNPRQAGALLALWMTLEYKYSSSRCVWSCKNFNPSTERCRKFESSSNILIVLLESVEDTNVVNLAYVVNFQQERPCTCVIIIIILSKKKLSFYALMNNRPFATADADGAMAKSVAPLSASAFPPDSISSSGCDAESKTVLIPNPNAKTILRFFQNKNFQNSWK